MQDGTRGPDSSRDVKAQIPEEGDLVFDSLVEDQEPMSFALLPKNFAFTIDDFSADEQKLERMLIAQLCRRLRSTVCVDGVYRSGAGELCGTIAI